MRLALLCFALFLEVLLLVLLIIRHVHIRQMMKLNDESIKSLDKMIEATDNRKA